MTTLIIGGSPKSVEPIIYEYIGWKLSKDLISCPYTKNRGGEISAEFRYVCTYKGVDYDASHIRVPSMIALKKNELLDYDNSRASAQSIPRNLCSQALEILDAHERKQQSTIAQEMNAAAQVTVNVIPLPSHKPQPVPAYPHQMAAAIPADHAPRAEMNG